MWMLSFSVSSTFLPKIEEGILSRPETILLLMMWLRYKRSMTKAVIRRTEIKIRGFLKRIIVGLLWSSPQRWRRGQSPS